MSTSHKVETRIEVSGKLRKVKEQSFLFTAKMLYKVCIPIIILIVSVSKNLLIVTIKFISLCCVCQPCYAAAPS